MAADGPNGVEGVEAAGAVGGRPLRSASERIAVAFLASALLAGLGLVLLLRLAPRSDAAAAAEAAMFMATLSAVAATLVGPRRGRAWAGSRALAVAFSLAAAVQLVAWVAETVGRHPVHSDAVLAAMGLLCAGVLATAIVDGAARLPEGRAEIASDASLVAATLGGAVYLVLWGGSPRGGAVAAVALTTAAALLAVLAVAARLVLALWVPSRAHVLMLTCAAAIGGSTVWVGWTRQHEGLATIPAAPTYLVAGALVVLAVQAGVRPLLAPSPSRNALELWWVRPVLLTASLGGASVTLGAAVIGVGHRSGGAVSGAIIALLVLLIGVRVFANHRSMVRTAARLGTALAGREEALASVRLAVDDVARSEARLRLLVDAAVDGVVELDGRGRVVRVNDAFCRLVRARAESILGRPWAEVARRAPGGGDSLELLPTTGQAELVDEGRTTFLEARSSVLPIDPPGTLLLIRDVTSSRVADQTIRTLFQFLQDRDEDRTRLLRRTNATIEAERNRIARDLHDGPIQGIAAAGLSLEAVKLMLKQGDSEGAGEMVARIRQELSDEAEGLRRLMGNLRPPLLEERGLIPAVRELAERFGADRRVAVKVRAQTESQVPPETEILAYRIVQEALSNIGKHADARNVTVLVEGTRGSLEVEVTDDGAGFDTNDMRDYLRRGKVGLASMRERTELGAGTFTVRSRPGDGTAVRATLPYEVLATTRTVP